AADRGPARAARVLPLARDRQLDDRGRNRREQPEQQRADDAERRVVVATDPEGEIADVRDRRGDRGDHGGKQDVAVADMGELVRKYAAQLVLAQQLADALR